jgi:ArsR family transcriptional regulator
MSDLVQVDKCAKLLQAIAEPNRIRIIESLWEGSRNVTELATMLDVKIVNVSHHLGVLRSSGLVRQEKKGRFVVYSLHPDYFSMPNGTSTHLDLGWCQLVIPRKPAEATTSV